jgi:beta-lactam-binding protein with PASTA domain
MVTHEPQPKRAERPAGINATTVTLQCVSSMAGTLLGESVGKTLIAKLVAGVLGALIGAFLTAPGRYRRRRIVAVALVLLLIQALRRAAGALAAERQPPRARLPASWAVVGVTALVGFTGGSIVTTVRDGWTEGPASVVAVPEVRGLTQAAAQSRLAGSDLRASTATEPSEAVAAGVATRTAPPAGSRVETETEVTLFVSSGPPPAALKVPQVTGLPEPEARSVLEDIGLQVQPRREASEAIVAGNATRTDPPAGTEVERDAPVVLFVSSGPASQPVRVPDVRGESRASAVALLRAAGLRVAAARTEPSQDVAAGAAIRTEPPAETEVERGADVTLLVSSGPAPGPARVPDVAGLPAAEAEEAIQRVDLATTTTAEASDTVAEGTVIRTDPVAGTSLETGSEVRLIVSSGPPPLVVPNVVGLPEADARDRVTAVQLKPAFGGQASSDSVPSGSVLRTEPVAGTEVERGSAVSLVVSCGKPPCLD